MKKLDLSKLTHDELMIETKKRKSAYTLFLFFIGLMIGTAIYTTISKGFTFFSLFPVFFMPVGIASKTSYDEATKENESRKL